MPETAEEGEAEPRAVGPATLADDVYRSEKGRETVQAERQVLEHFSPRWRRLSDSVLVFVPVAGDSVVFTDVLVEDWSDFRRYVLRDYLAQVPAFLLERRFYEGRDYLLIDESTGQILADLDALPVFSPSGERFVTVSMSGLEVSYGRNRIEIYRVEQENLTKEYSLEDTAWGASNPLWLDERTIALTKHTVDYTPSYSLTESKIVLVLANGGWELKEDVR